MKFSDIDLRLLRVFQAVADAGGFAKAQGALGISQPAISAQIGKLEDRLGLRLCDRGPKGFALTSNGKEVLQEITALLEKIDASATRLNAIGAPLNKRVRFGVVDCMVSDPDNPLISVLRDLRLYNPNLRTDIGIFDYLACLEELRANRLDIAIVGIAGNELIPSETEAIPLYREISNLYCSPDHPCAQVTNAKAMKAILQQSDISAHSFVFNPIDKTLDPKLLDHSDGIAQDTIELTAYLALAGTHVGLLPDHFAAAWVSTGALVSLAPMAPTIHSEFHAIRLRTNRPNEPLEFAWQALRSRG